MVPQCLFLVFTGPALPGENAKRRKTLEPISWGESSVLDKLLELVGRGDAHVQTAAEIARAVDRDSNNSAHPKLQQLAACGAYGKCDGNTERDFQRLLRGSNGFNLEPYTITLTLQAFWKDFNICLFLINPLVTADSSTLPSQKPKSCAPQVEKDEDPVPVQASVLLPHEVFGALSDMGEAKVGGSKSHSHDSFSLQTKTLSLVPASFALSCVGATMANPSQSSGNISRPYRTINIIVCFMSLRRRTYNEQSPFPFMVMGLSFTDTVNTL